MDSRIATLRDIHRDLVTVASQEKLNPRRRKMLERAIERSADLIEAEKPRRRRIRWPRWKMATISAVFLGIVAAVVTIVKLWVGS